MYESFFKLKECPFKLPPDPEFLFLSQQHKLALVHLEYGLSHQAGFIVITGEIGTGKTTLVKTMLRRMAEDTVVASIFNTTVGAEEFLNLILDDYELPWNENETHTQKLDKLKSFLIDIYTKGKKAVLIVDEAQNLSMETLEEIRLLSNFQTTKDYLVHIFLVGQPELKYKLTHHSLRQLAQRISVHYHINPLTEKETEEYIAHRLKVSGCDDVGSCFSEDALEEIYTQTLGFPRLINLLCDACLVNAFADQVKPVTRSIVTDTIKGDGAGNFWQIASSQSLAKQPATNRENIGDVPPPKAPANQAGPAMQGFSADQLSDLQNRVSELEKTVQVLSRLVNERLIDKSHEEIRELASKKILKELLDREQKKVISLAADRKNLQKKLKMLLSKVEQQQIAQESQPEPYSIGEFDPPAEEPSSQQRKTLLSKIFSTRRDHD